MGSSQSAVDTGMWAIVVQLPSTMQYSVIPCLCLLSLTSASFDRGRHRTPIHTAHHPHQHHLGSPRAIQLHHNRVHMKQSSSPFLLPLPHRIVPLRGLFSLGESRSRLSKGRPHSVVKKVQGKTVPNFIHLEADKIPGYQKFKLDEYIRSKPDVIHYVDSPVIKPKKTYQSIEVETKENELKV